MSETMVVVVGVCAILVFLAIFALAARPAAFRRSSRTIVARPERDRDPS